MYFILDIALISHLFHSCSTLVPWYCCNPPVILLENLSLPYYSLKSLVPKVITTSYHIWQSIVLSLVNIKLWMFS